MLITKYDFRGTDVRVMTVEGEPWWVAKDVCDVLDIANVSDALSGLEDDEKTTIANPDSRPGQGAQTLHGPWWSAENMPKAGRD